MSTEVTITTQHQHSVPYAREIGDNYSATPTFSEYDSASQSFRVKFNVAGANKGVLDALKRHVEAYNQQFHADLTVELPEPAVATP